MLLLLGSAERAVLDDCVNQSTIEHQVAQGFKGAECSVENGYINLKCSEIQSKV